MCGDVGRINKGKMIQVDGPSRNIVFAILSHIMYLFTTFREPALPQHRLPLFTISNQHIKLTVMWGS